jgi:8-oxo-dGTP pyrophosphatase MutT (NUDIX family)
MHPDAALVALSALPPSAIRDEYLEFVSSGEHAALRRDGGPEHLTASCFVFSPDLARTLLCFHRKGGFWVQFGGHLEPQDASLASAGLREAREESGIADLELLSQSIVDLDRHELHGGFGCAAHWDVGLVAIADPTTAVAVSDESEDVRWFPVGQLPVGSVAGFGERIERARDAAASLPLLPVSDRSTAHDTHE